MEKTGMQGSSPGAASVTEYSGNIGEHTTEGLGRLTDTAHQTIDRMSQVASQAASRLTERGHELWELQGRAADTARAYVREHPIATIGIAIAVGLIISRLTSRR